MAVAHDSSPRKLDAKAEFSDRVKKSYEAAKSRFEAHPTDAEAAWQFGRACFDWADLSTSSSQREKIANEGIAACRKLIAQDSKSVQGHYYLFMNLGQLAQTKTVGALKLLGQMEDELKAALALDPKFDFGGPDRNLGLLYLQAPGWPVSIGSKFKSRDHLQKALQLAPEYPDNLLNLIEAEIKWGDKSSAQRDLSKLDKVWVAAHSKLTGDEWAQSWADWESRRDTARQKTAALSQNH